MGTSSHELQRWTTLWMCRLAYVRHFAVLTTVYILTSGLQLGRENLCNLVLKGSALRFHENHRVTQNKYFFSASFSYWEGVVPQACADKYGEIDKWKCYFGEHIYPTLTCKLSKEEKTRQGPRSRRAGGRHVPHNIFRIIKS